MSASASICRLWKSKIVSRRQTISLHVLPTSGGQREQAGSQFVLVNMQQGRMKKILQRSDTAGGRHPATLFWRIKLTRSVSAWKTSFALYLQMSRSSRNDTEEILQLSRFFYMLPNKQQCFSLLT